MEAGSVVRAVFEFLPSVSEELPLFTGDVIEVLSVVDEFWLLGNKDGVTGQFPSTFVEEVTIPSTKPGDRLYVCVSDFSSAEPGNLSLKRGDVVVGEAGGSVDLGGTWQRGCNAWGVRGLFPTSCVKELHLSGRSRQLSERSAQAQASELPPYALGQARALMSLHAQLNEELDFREGDLIIITGLPEPGWFQGELEGRRGIFPEGFVELLGPLRSPQEPVDCQYLGNDSEQYCYEDSYEAGEVEAEEEFVEEEVFVKEEEEQKETAGVVEEEEEEEGGVYLVALYEFRAMEPEELDFDTGDRIRLISTLEDGWLEGELRGRRGIFPHRFVKMEGDTQKTEDETNIAEAEEDKENSGTSEYSPSHLFPNGSESEPEWRTYEDHTVWDLDYFERTEEQRCHSENKRPGAQTSNRGQTNTGSGPGSQPRRPAAPAQHGPERPKSTPPARPRLPSRPNLPVRSNTHHGRPSGSDRSKYTNGGSRLSKLSHSLTLPSTQSGWSKGKTYSPPSDGGTTNSKSASLGQVLFSLAQAHKQKKLSRHASVSDADMVMGGAERRRSQSPRGSNGFMPTSFTLEALASTAGDLEAKLSQQLFEFEKSLTASLNDTNRSSTVPRDLSSVDDLNQSQSRISRHFSILDFNNESDIIRGSLHPPAPHHLQSKSASSSLERRRTLRPPPPRPRVLRPPAPPAYKPARPAPRPPPHCPRQNTAPPSSNPLTNSPIFYTPDEPAVNILDQESEGQPEFGDLAAAQEQEIQSQLEAEKEMEREMELEHQRQVEEEERYQLLLRLQEVEHDMEAYAHTAEELRAMLEEEEDETARMQAMENLEFCNYTLETLALEQQQLQDWSKPFSTFAQPLEDLRIVSLFFHFWIFLRLVKTLVGFSVSLWITCSTLRDHLYTGIMPRKGRRSQAQKERWRKAGAPELPDRPDMPVDTPPCSSSTPNKKLGSTLPAGPFWTAGEARVDFHPQCGTGKRHRVLKWPTSPFSGKCHKLVIPREVPGKKFVLIVGDSHLRALVDDVIQMPESQLSFGFMSTPGASASQIHKDVLHAAVPRRPDAVCVMAPSNNLTSSTVDVAGVDFANLLTTCLNRWSKVFVVGFVPRLVVDVQHQDLLRQEYRRVASRMNVKYFSSVEHFPLSNLILWSNDGVHLSDREGMGILVQLLWSAASDQLLTPPATPEVSPKPPVKNAPGQGSSPAPPSAQPRKRRTIGQDGKTSQPRKSRRIASQQEKESLLPLNPIWFSGQALSAMEEVSPSHESCLAHVKATQPVPPHKKAQTPSSAVTRRRSRQVSPLNKDLVSTATALYADGTPVSKIEKASVANMPFTVGHDVTSTKDLVSTATALYADGTPVSKVEKASVANMPSTVGHDVTSTKDKTRSSSHLIESIQASHSQNDTRPHTGGMPGSGSQCVPNSGCIANGSAAKDMKP